MINLYINRKLMVQSRPRVTFKNGKVWAYEPLKIIADDFVEIKDDYK